MYFYIKNKTYSMSKVSFEVIEKFLEGRDPQKYIVGIESSYGDNFVDLIINDPVNGKSIERHEFKPFIWFKPDILNKLYGGSKSKQIEAKSRFGVKIKDLTISTPDGFTPERLYNGYKKIAHTTNGYSSLIAFFKEGGVDIWGEENKGSFLTLSPSEQFLIQTGKRMFKGFNDYNDVHRLQFDLETDGLDPSKDSIFQIGIKDNRGFELILETIGDTPKERRESEKQNIIDFFNIIDGIRPDIITAYNSENFDWPFFEARCERLSINFKSIVKTLHPKKSISRKDSTLKLGQESIHYLQTNMWGYSILDISHAVRRAQSINSDIKKWSLKYITKFSKVAKKNRVYVPGNKLKTIWSDTSDYWFNDNDGSWGLLEGSEFVNELPEPLKIVKGNYIVQRYLLDDLWETEQVDTIYNQASFLLAKILPTSYMRSSTMGTAGQWKLIMCAWSYENNLGIPELQPKRNFVGGLSRLIKVGYARGKGVVKCDFAALYPKTQLTWSIFPEFDISGVMDGLLTYVVDKRDEFKFLTSDHKDKGKELQVLLDVNIHKLNEKRINNANEMIEKEYKLSSDYDKKQLPLKILANSWFGSYGAPYLFPWGDSNCAEETTCRGRQSLRFMIKFFTEKYGFDPLVLDTDGCNFTIPDTIDDIKYEVKASHWKTKKYESGTILTGLEAAVSEFNELYMEGRMGLDVDDIYESAINFKRKNYANKLDGKVKLVGNSIKSKSMPIYIEEFINEGIGLLLDGKGYEFISLYYDTIDKIYNYKIPVLKIASKSKVKITPDNYKNVYCMQKNKAGNFKSRQAHMELILKHDLKVDIGDEIYYINTGTAKSHSDIKAIKNKENGTTELQFYCELIPQKLIDSNPDYTIDNYNIAKYISALNSRITPLLVCFSEDVRDRILIDVVKDRKTKQLKLKDRTIFLESECDLVSGKPLSPDDQDDYYEDLMKIEDREIEFWISVNKLPNFMTEEEWEALKKDYYIRKDREREEGIENEKEFLLESMKRMEINDYKILKTKGVLPTSIDNIVDVVNNDGVFELISKKWSVVLYPFDKIFEYESDAYRRNEWYGTVKDKHDSNELYDMWLDYLAECDTFSGSIDNVLPCNIPPKDEFEHNVNNIDDEWNF